MEIFVGNLSFEANQGDVKKLFEGFGDVASVVILMRKEKKVPKSRGFGFVQMPEEQQALAAIAALNGKEFMSRALNVEPARPKIEKQTVSEAKEKEQPQVRVLAQPVFHKYPALKDKQVRPSGRYLAVKDRQVRPSGLPGTYGGGRRTASYLKRKALAGEQVVFKPRRRSQDNPLRWRKKKSLAKPWQKSTGEQKPWGKSNERRQKSKSMSRAKPGSDKR